MKKLILLTLLFPFIGMAQNKGTYFEHGLSWQQVKEKAKKENKHLFVDCFTTWCGPCRVMANNVFPQKKVGDFFNKNFVNVKVQFDKTKDDSEAVKSWYEDAEFISKEFDVQAYPTFLIFSPQGELVHRVVGGGDADEFINKVQKALDPETQYYTLLKRNKDINKLSPVSLREATAAAEAANDSENVSKFASAYLSTQTDLCTKVNLEFVKKYVTDSKSLAFQFVLKNPEKVDAILGKGAANDFLSAIVYKENVYNEARRTRTKSIDSLVAAAKAKYPSVDISKSTDLLKIWSYQLAQNWDKFEPAVLTYMGKYWQEVNRALLATFSNSILEHGKTPESLAAAELWSKRDVEETKEVQFASLATYGKVLYKLGKKEQAIDTIQKAVDVAPEKEKNRFQVMLDQMKSGTFLLPG